MAAESKTAVAAAFLGNGALALLKGVSAAATGSAAMLAETFHSIADTGNQALLFLGMRLGRRPPDRARPFGHGRNVYFWAFVVSVMLFSLGGAFSIWEGVRRFLHPGEHEGAPLWAYGVLAAGFVFESISLGIAIHALGKAKGEASLREYWRDNRDPTLPTVVLEDSAALLSLVIAGVGIGLAQTTGNVVWDAAASAMIGVMLVAIAIFLAFENYSLLIGEGAPGDVETAIRRVASADEAVLGVVALHTMHLGPQDILIVLGLQFRREFSAPRIEAAVTRLQERIKHAVGGSTNALLIVIEPTRSDGTAFGRAAASVSEGRN